MQDAYPSFIQPEIGEVTVSRNVLPEDTQSPSGAGLRLDTSSFNFFLGFKGVIHQL